MYSIQFNSIQFNIYFHIKYTQTSRNIKITKKQNMEKRQEGQQGLMIVHPWREKNK